jgi:hypothetical protein
MDKATLKNIRLLAPGVIVLVCLLPCIKLFNFVSATERLPDGVILILLTFVAQIIGGTYYGFDIRNLLWRNFVLNCRDNVWAKMIIPNEPDSRIPQGIGRMNKKQAMRIFYNIIDNDPSLSDQAHDVRLNGAVLTTIIDSILITGFFFVTYIIAFLIARKYIFVWSAMVIAPLHSLLWILKSRISKKHIKLENEQLEVIVQLHNDKVIDLINKY